MEQQRDELNKEQLKELKKLLDAHVSVATHRLGRAPTLDELKEMLNETDIQDDESDKKEDDKGKKELPAIEEMEENDPNEPKILSFKVFYGVSGKSKKEGKVELDPHNVLYYQSPDGAVYSVAEKKWLDNVPEILEFLPHRPLIADEQGKDVLRAIVHGVMDDESFAALDKVGLINSDGRRVYELYKKAQDLTNQLNSLDKSDERIDPDFDVEDDENEEREKEREDKEEGHIKKINEILEDLSDELPSENDLKEEKEEEVDKDKTDFSPDRHEHINKISKILDSLVEDLHSENESSVDFEGQTENVEIEKGDNIVQKIVSEAMKDVKAHTIELVHKEVARYVEPLYHSINNIIRYLGIEEVDIIDSDDDRDDGGLQEKI